MTSKSINVFVLYKETVVLLKENEKQKWRRDWFGVAKSKIEKGEKKKTMGFISLGGKKWEMNN